MSVANARYWIQHLRLNAHIEGGWYAETYQSTLTFNQDQLPAGFNGNRHACTHIYFLLEQGQFSAFHRIASDELWHFYSGDPLVIYEIGEEGGMKEHLLGNDPVKGQSLCCVIKAGNWFGSRVMNDGAYSLAGCTVAPGFDFADFEMATRKELLAQYPQHSQFIYQMTR